MSSQDIATFSTQTRPGLYSYSRAWTFILMYSDYGNKGYYPNLTTKFSPDFDSISQGIVTIAAKYHLDI